MKKILFLCTGNSARSQMAEGFAKNLFRDKIEAYSAGTIPTTVNKYAVEVMAEIGIDISNQRSKSINEFKDINFDYIITLCETARQACPLFPVKAEYIHWDIEDPAKALGSEENILSIFRKTRDKIKTNILELVKDII